MVKRPIPTIHEKNTVIAHIIDAIIGRNRFLVLGHQTPDEDCVASMVGISLILSKFSKHVSICMSKSLHEHYQYLLNICRYNSVSLVSSCRQNEQLVDAVIVCDTPKRSMIESFSSVEHLLLQKDVPVIEIDHHIGGDSEYIGDEGLCLVTDASSSSELVGHLAVKLAGRKELLAQYQIDDLFSRNLVLAVLTGIIGDTNMGQFLGSRKERKYYAYFSTMLNRILIEKTVKETNFANKEEVFLELQRHSSTEEWCFDYIMKKKRFSRSIGYILLTKSDMGSIEENCDQDTFVSVTRAAANNLAEESGKLGLVAYSESNDEGRRVQFRLRRSHIFRDFDLRKVLSIFSITDGGGHEGAIGFRFHEDELDGVETYVENLVNGIENVIVK